DAYAFLNPHLTLTTAWHGQSREVAATRPDWKKWLPSNPTCPHWYTPEHFDRLLAAYIAHDADRGTDRTVREFVAEFPGRTASAKQRAVLDMTGLARTNLSALAGAGGLRADVTARLLAAMKEHTKPVKPAALGLIGKDHLAQRFEVLGCAMQSFAYKKQVGATEDVPWVMETAFAWNPSA